MERDRGWRREREERKARTVRQRRQGAAVKKDKWMGRAGRWRQEKELSEERAHVVFD